MHNCYSLVVTNRKAYKVLYLSIFMKKGLVTSGLAAILLAVAPSDVSASFKGGVPERAVVSTLSPDLYSGDHSGIYSAIERDAAGVAGFGSPPKAIVYSHDTFDKAKYQPYGPEAVEIKQANEVIPFIGKRVIRDNPELGGLIFSLEDYVETLHSAPTHAEYEVGIKIRAFESYSEEDAVEKLSPRLRVEYEAMFSEIDLDGDNLVLEGSGHERNSDVLLDKFNSGRLSGATGYKIDSLRDSKGVGSGNKVLYFLDEFFRERSLDGLIE